MRHLYHRPRRPYQRQRPFGIGILLDVIDAVEASFLPSIQNGDVKALVVKVAPAFTAHLMAAQKLGKQLAQK